MLTNAWSKLIRTTVSVSITLAVTDVCVLLEGLEPKRVSDMCTKNVIFLRRFSFFLHLGLNMGGRTLDTPEVINRYHRASDWCLY